MKVKSVRFTILSNCMDNNVYMKKQNMHDEYESLYTPDKIDKEINLFCENKVIHDIKVNEIYQSFTDINGTNRILLNYTILYDD